MSFEYITTLVDEFGAIVSDPTIVSGDAKISIDEADYTNLTNLPVVSPSGSSDVVIEISDDEVDSTDEGFIVQFQQQSGSDWARKKLWFSKATVSLSSWGDALDILEGDYTEYSTALIVKKAGKSEIILNKAITGSQLSPTVRVITS